MTELACGVLGPVFLRVAQRTVELSGKQSALLAVLVLDANATVSRDRLVAALWDSPPTSAVSNLQTYVARLRKALPAGIRILTKGTGYLLEADAGLVDLLVFERETRLARSAAAEGAPEAAAGHYERALALWRGQPAEGVRLPAGVLARLDELEERRTRTRLDHAETKLGLGHAQDVMNDLRRLLAEHPLQERAWYLLMLALARTGQRDMALDVFRQARDVLVGELGVEPGKDLQQLQARVLGGDLPSGAPPGPRDGGVCQLPPDAADFVGRADELAAALETLRPARPQAGPESPVPVCVISGQGGAGKTTLAVHAAHHLRRDFRDGQLYVNLHGAGQSPVTPETALGRFLRALGVDSAAIPASLEERAEMYRGKLADRRFLVVLDDAADEGQLRPLLPGTPGCAVLVTSRRRLTGLPAARRIELPLMPPGEARELLRSVIGAERAAEAAGDTDRLVQLCGGLPLAVRIAGAKLAARPHWNVDQLVARLRDTRDRLRHLSHGSQAVRATLAVGYQGLTLPAQRLFRLLGLLEAPDFAAWTAAALLDAPPAEAEDLVEELVDVRLLDVAGRDRSGQTRFRFHDLTRAYARECAEAAETEAERTAAVRRAVSGWLALTRQAHIKLCGGDYQLPRGGDLLWSPGPQVTDGHVLPDPLAWIEAERAALVAAVRQSATLAACWELAAAAMHPLETRGLYDEWHAMHETALASTRATGDVRGQAVALYGLARLYFARNELARCEQVIEESLALFDRAADPYGHALAQVTLAELHRLRGRAADALACYEQAGDGLARAGDRFTEITRVRGIGRLHFSQGRYDLATRHIRRAIMLADRTGDVRSREFTRIVLGEIELERGDLAAAEDCFSRARACLDELGFPIGIAYAVLGLGMVRLAQHDLADAERRLRHALEIYHGVQDRVSQARVLFTWADLRRRQGRSGEAIATLTEVIAIAGDIPAPRRQGLALRALGDLHHELGDLPQAADAWRRALTVLGAASPEAAELTTKLELHGRP
ncbi:BTAD domain-containing putative transcriptional regulator [Nonomuraea sp. ATR24]|uniref:AfsR/SARP family transcriptional regulator n=1 Tax=Nonomuraea sp. ATR24 TaxID=1676744 RepID=UPI0035C24070